MHISALFLENLSKCISELRMLKQDSAHALSGQRMRSSFREYIYIQTRTVTAHARKRDWAGAFLHVKYVR